MKVDFDNIQEALFPNFKGGERLELKAGDVHYCPEGHSHTLINESDEDLEFSAVVPKQ